MLSRKEKLLQKQREAEEARINAEFDAKMTAKQERKKVEKTIAEIDESLKKMLQRAAEAKVKGFEEQYRSCVGMIKLARARKHQAEVFLFQMDTMQEMQSISKSSQSLLVSMGNVMNSLGKLSLDKSVMANTQRDFAAVQRELDRQTGTIETFLSGMEMQLPDDMPTDYASDDQIDAEIDAIINGGKSGSGASSVSGSSSNDEGSTDESIEKMKRLLDV